MMPALTEPRVAAERPSKRICIDCGPYPFLDLKSGILTPGILFIALAGGTAYNPVGTFLNDESVICAS